MSEARKIGKNTIALMISSIVFSGLALILSIFIGRILGDVEFGKYSFASTFPQLLTVFLDLGYATLLIRDVSRNKSLSDCYTNNIFTFRLIIFPLIFIILFFLINIMGYPEDTKDVVYLFGFFTFLRSISSIFYVTMRAYEKMEYEAAIVIITSVLRNSLGLLSLFLGYGLIALGLIFIFSALIEFFIVLIVCVKKFVKIKFEIPFSFIRKTIKNSLPLGLLSIFGIIYIRLDTVMLSLFKGDAVVGWYNAAYNLVLGLQFIPLLLMQSLLPTMSFYYVSSKTALQITYEKSFKYLFILGLPISVGTFFLADKFIPLFYGNQFLNSVIALKILAWDVLLYFLYTCAGFVLISTDKQNHMASTLVISIILNFILNLVLIPLYSYVGAGIATLASELFLLIVYLYISHKNNFKLNFKGILLPPSVACGIMAIFLYFFTEINVFLQIIISIIIYLSLVFLLKGINKHDLILFKQLIKKS